MNWIKLSLVCVVVGIIYLSLMPPDGPVKVTVNDKIGHFIAYSVLTINAGLLVSSKKWIGVGVLAFLLSTLLEFLQHYVPGRHTDYRDLIANGTGVVIGLVVLVTLSKQLLHLLRKIKIVS
jgi:VanZ family protein